MFHLCLFLTVELPHRLGRSLRKRSERGQATAEYALVLLGAASIAVFILSWVSRTNLIGRLLEAVFESLLSRVK